MRTTVSCTPSPKSWQNGDGALAEQRGECPHCGDQTDEPHHDASTDGRLCKIAFLRRWWLDQCHHVAGEQGAAQRQNEIGQEIIAEEHAPSLAARS